MDSNCNFEIIILDDCSEIQTVDNNYVSAKQNISYTYLKANIGRSSIRNKLAECANYEYLIFLDADTMPVKTDFITNYINTLKQYEVITGGILYKTKNKNEQDLRYVYGLKRETTSAKQRLSNPYASFLSGNFAIKKYIFDEICFDEKHNTYGYEDTLFALLLKKNSILIHHINNPVYHLYFESGPEFAIKIQSSLNNLMHYYKLKKITAQDVKLLRFFEQIDSLKLTNLAGNLFKKNYNWFMSYFEKNQPKLWLFDLYRIGYLCSIKNKD